MLIRPGVTRPELACLTLCSEPTPGVHPGEWVASLYAADEGYYFANARLYPRRQVGNTHKEAFRYLITNPEVGLAGANVAFDMCVMMAHDPEIIPAVFQAYRDGRVYDVQIAQKLLDIAGGRFRKEFRGTQLITYKYNLADLTRRLVGWEISKPKYVKDERTGEQINVTPDHWRLRYGELIGVPCAQWPDGAIAYAIDDARATLACKLAQDPHAAYLTLQAANARKFLSLSLIEAWGLRTREEGVERFAAEVETKIAELKEELVSIGLVRPDGSRDTKAAARTMVQVCKEKGLEVIATKGQKKKIKAGAEWDPEALTGVALDADSCERAEDPRLSAYAEYVTFGAVGSKDLPMLRSGATHPIHTRFDLAETLRTTSSSPNVQNIRRLPGIRECFTPRNGYVFMQADYPGLELKTLAQVCVWLFGSSDLADAINSGLDPHLMLAANMDHCSYAEAKAKYKADKNWPKRLAAKVGNFGLPGGLGAQSFCDYAYKSYGVRITLEEAKELKRYWLATWPEMKHYFAWVSSQCDRDGGEILQFIAPGTNFVRGRTRYTAACNTPFQHLGAMATGEMLFEVSCEQYAAPQSPLYGTRSVNFVHDELIGEVEAHRDTSDTRASDAVKRLCHVMVESANRFLPDVPFKLEDMEPTLMSHWSKDAKTLYDERGNVLVWKGKAAA